MAKALLLNALHDALSDYVVGLSPERLKVGVWSGKIVLDELQVCNLLRVCFLFSLARMTKENNRCLLPVCLKDCEIDLRSCCPSPLQLWVYGRTHAI